LLYFAIAIVLRANVKINPS